MKKTKFQILVIGVFQFIPFLLCAQTGFPVGEPTYVPPPTLTRTIDQTKPVYSIPAIINVSNGVAQYNIPLNIPTGVNGMEPNVTIGYNSAGGNGLLGFGWHLSGLSSISRTGDNIIFDNKL